ncbi:MAG: hypothetical protein EAZ92_08815 [Candidatus Kapaibacterium sp.]|nr:MAG: hypothetical protein EAZ92_08815 [Candidatus Kapabacteria bacterium]
MRYVLCHIVLLCAFALGVLAQEAQKDSVPQASEIRTANNNFFLEAGGNAIAYSLNYERIMGNHFVLRGGLSFLPVQSAEFRYLAILPVSVSYLIGSTHYLELGLGTMFASYNGTEARWQYNRGSAIDISAEVTGTPKFAISPFPIAIPIIGYRWHPLGGGLNARIAFTPLVSFLGILPFGGISLGWSF